MKSVPVSVAVPAYNCSSTIARCIQSLNSGSRQPDQIVISYDKSSDDTLKVILGLKMKYDNIVLVMNEGPNGAAANRNNALEYCTNEVFTHIDADDTIGKYKIEREFTQIEKGASISFSDYQISRKPYLPNCRVNLRNFYNLLSNDNLLVSDLVNRTFGVPRDLMFTREIWQLVGPFDTELKMYEDLDFKVRLFLGKHRWGYTSVAGTYYKQTENSLSRSDQNLKDYYLKKIHEKYLKLAEGQYRDHKKKIKKSIVDYYLTKLGLIK